MKCAENDANKKPRPQSVAVSSAIQIIFCLASAMGTATHRLSCLRRA